jgi:hypothetical protein
MTLYGLNVVAWASTLFVLLGAAAALNRPLKTISIARERSGLRMAQI